jgi:hypothetical protein
MNEQIKEFINRATVVAYDELLNLETSRFDREKFAELIIRECIIATGNCAGTGDMIKEHFGVEE